MLENHSGGANPLPGSGKPRSGSVDDRSELTQIIHQIRKRWRLKLAMRGAAFVVAGGVLALLVSAYGLERLKFSPGSVIAFRVAMIMISSVLTGYFFVLPQWRRVTDEQVALYLEECEPSLETAILSAIEAERQAGSADSSASPALARRLVEQAVERCGAIEHGRRLEAKPFKQYASVLGGTVVAALLVFVLGPAYLRHGASALLILTGDPVEASPYRIDVKPGNTTVPRGSDQLISARIEGFASDEAELMVRKAVNQPFERVAMVLNNDTKRFDGMLFDLPSSIDYFVESGGVKSHVFTMHAAELPYVKQLEMEYVFPAYTGLAPRKIENGGDIAVLQGTQVRMRITPTMKAPTGQILVDGKAVALTPDGDTFIGELTVNKDGFYRVELQGGPENKMVNASPQYTIDVLEDLPPTVSIAKPGRDSTASPIEEFAVEARADDDFGVRQLQLVYSVNGGPEQIKTLVDSTKGHALPQVSAAHTFYLEELKLTPGDSVSYYARAVDNDGVSGGKSVSSDIYFVRIRKFDEQFRAATSQGGGGGGGGGGAGQMNVDALSQQQRQIISATHNIVRDKKTMTPAKLRENLVVVSLSQQKLREQVEGLVGRMNSRLVEPDPAFQRIAELLPKAAEEMRAAEKQLQAQAADNALPPENRALQQLQKAEEEYEKQVSQQRGGGGGGGGGAGSISEDLADLFKQDLDKLANQYETAQSAQQQQSDQQVDAVMEKLRELARRQEQEAERQRQQALAGQLGQGGGDSQRQLAEQAEEAARQLERLSRERNRPDLAQAAQQMRQAAEAMRRAAASGSSSAGQASAALGQIRDAQRRLEQEQSARGTRDMQDAQQQADQLAKEQRDIANEAAQLGQSGANRSQKTAQLTERKNQLESKLGDLEKQLDKMSGDLRKDEKDASRKVQEAADGIRDNKLKERVRYTNSMLRNGQTDASMEGDITAGIDALRNKLGQAQAAMGQGNKSDRMANNLDRARNIVRGVDSMQNQMRQGQNGQQGQQGRNGQQNQNAQQGQRGQQGQQGQQGQNGQQGQSGQQGQGQQGQQGQGQGQGQQGQQGGQGGGQRGDNYAGGMRGGDGGYYGGGGPYNRGDDYGGWGQRVYTPGEIRQFRDQARYWANEAQNLRDQLRNDGATTTDLDEVLKQMRQLDDDRVYKDAQELERLQTLVAEGLKRFEFGLRRKVEDSTGDQPALASTDDVPRGFRDLVDEYYRSLSKTSK
jgi:hypothetical protein